MRESPFMRRFKFSPHEKWDNQNANSPRLAAVSAAGQIISRLRKSPQTRQTALRSCPIE